MIFLLNTERCCLCSYSQIIFLSTMYFLSPHQHPGTSGEGGVESCSDMIVPVVSLWAEA